MKSEIIAIGTEILVGSILNTNARFLSQKLAEQAIDVYRHTTVGDNIDRIVACLEEAALRADLLITSGGLGPTEDDVTLRAVSLFTKRPLRLHAPTYAHVRKALAKRHFRFSRLSSSQCYLPRGATVFQNLRGTAPGLLIRFKRLGSTKWLLVLPGPPRELEPIFTDRALPHLLKVARIPREHFVVRSVHIAGLLESQVAEKTTDLLRLKPPLTVGVYAKPGQVELKIMSKAATLKSAVNAADRVESTIRSRLARAVYGVDGDTLASAVGSLLRSQNLTLATAESCTGGLLGHLLTEVPGSSDYFIGGVVAYANRVKVEKLGVCAQDLKIYGAVSDKVAKQMAEGVRKAFSSDYGIGVTGIAGPSGGSKTKPVGLVHIALAGPGGTRLHELQFYGTRSDIKSRCAQKILDLLRLELLSTSARTRTRKNART